VTARSTYAASTYGSALAVTCRRVSSAVVCRDLGQRDRAGPGRHRGERPGVRARTGQRRTRAVGPARARQRAAQQPRAGATPPARTGQPTGTGPAQNIQASQPRVGNRRRVELRQPGRAPHLDGVPSRRAGTQLPATRAHSPRLCGVPAQQIVRRPHERTVRFNVRSSRRKVPHGSPLEDQSSVPAPAGCGAWRRRHLPIVALS